MINSVFQHTKNNSLFNSKRNLLKFLSMHFLKETLIYDEIERVRKNDDIFNHLKWISATEKQFWAKIIKFPDFSLTFLVFKNSPTILQNFQTFP